ncbi:MAG: carboxypeptidase-like regulatory domain-containing protein [Xanthomonadales bacterium]|nr:carboxypeptidase-like regulatory domain-containing protein [Xanthomonadales bacterium]
MRKWLWVALLASIWVAYPWFVIVEDIDGRVVDEAGQPIEGVLVTAKWRENYRMSLAATDRITFINAMESVTDADGRYHFPGFFYVYPLLRRMQKGEPMVDFYKEGLRTNSFKLSWLRRTHPKKKGSFKPAIIRGSQWNDISVELVEIDTDYHQRDAKATLWWFVTEALRYDNCLWANIPNAIAATFDHRNPNKYPAAYIDGDEVYFLSKIKFVIIQNPKSMQQCGVDLSYFEVFKEWNIKIAQ